MFFFHDIWAAVRKKKSISEELLSGSCYWSVLSVSLRWISFIQHYIVWQRNIFISLSQIWNWGIKGPWWEKRATTMVLKTTPTPLKHMFQTTYLYTVHCPCSAHQTFYLILTLGSSGLVSAHWDPNIGCLLRITQTRTCFLGNVLKQTLRGVFIGAIHWVAEGDQKKLTQT